MGFQNELCLLSFFMAVAGVLGGEYCHDIDDGYTQWCSYGCCGYLDSYCCGANVALIVGMTLLGILVVSVIITVVCCCVRRRASAGQVIHTNPGSGLVVTTAQTSMTAGQPMPYATQGYQPGVYPAQPYPVGQMPPPPMHPYGAPVTPPAPGAMAPPPYTAEMGGRVNAGYDYKTLE